MSQVQRIYDIAIRLMDAQDHLSGRTDMAENREYRLRTPDLLSSVLHRARDASREPLDAQGRRLPCPQVADMEADIPLDERVCLGVLPYALAALLLSEEDPGRANFFWQSFEALLREAQRQLPAPIEAVEDLYGGIGHTQFGSWRG